jgi:DNA-binding LacI/PurR family transcriptional regulator
MKKRITQRDIAKKAGVDVSTVSLALSSHPRIPEVTRARIEAVAKELGYRPDPALSSIASARWKGRRDDKGTTLAFLVDDLKTAEIELKLYLDGVRQQADLLGYHVETFSLSDYPSPEALWRVIRTRGIRGTVIGQSRQKLPPALFKASVTPVVQCGFLREVEGEVVRPDLRLAVVETLTRLQETYQNIACFLPIEKGLHSDRIILGAVLVEAKMARRGIIRVLTVPPGPRAADLAALKAINPDAILTINEKHKALLKTDCPVFTLHTLPPFEGKQGMDLRLTEAGRAAVNLLEMKMRNLPLATAPYRQTLLIEPRPLGIENRKPAESG